MKKQLVLLFLLSVTVVRAQLEDRVWPIGFSPGLVTFLPDTVILDTIENYNIYADSYSPICNAQGELQFFVSGPMLYLPDGTPMPCIDSLYRGRYCAASSGGRVQHAVVLPYPDREGLYVVVYNSQSNERYEFSADWFTDEFVYAVVDMNFYGPGKPCLISARNMLHTGPMAPERVTACQHANGRDWWIFNRGYCSNQFIRFLLTPEGIKGPYHQFIGPAFCYPLIHGSSCFSPDGRKYAEVNSSHPLMILDFDRCSGLFSSPCVMNVPAGFVHDTLTNQDIWQPTGGLSVAFSGDSRYVYVNNQLFIDQFDLQLHEPLFAVSEPAQIQASRQRVFQWDFSVHGWQCMWKSRLTPDKRIVIECWQGVGPNRLHMIEKPNVGGVGCDVRISSFPVRTLNAFSLPNYPVFGLGAVPGSLCDTLTAAAVSVGEGLRSGDRLELYPNPAEDEVVMGVPTGGKIFEVLDMTGRKVYGGYCEGEKSRWRVKGWPSGLYTVRVSGPAGEWTGKLQVK